MAFRCEKKKIQLRKGRRKYYIIGSHHFLPDAFFEVCNARALLEWYICQSLEFWKMQNSYNATRVKIWNLFLLSKNFIAINFEVKKIRASATRAIIQLRKWQTDCLTDWLTDGRTNWLTDGRTNWLTDWLTDWLSNWLTDWLTNRKAEGCLPALNTGWLVCCLPTGLPAGWLNDWLRAACLPARTTSWLVCWLTDCLAGGLAYWLTS